MSSGILDFQGFNLLKAASIVSLNICVRLHVGECGTLVLNNCESDEHMLYNVRAYNMKRLVTENVQVDSSGALMIVHIHNTRSYL